MNPTSAQFACDSSPQENAIEAAAPSPDQQEGLRTLHPAYFALVMATGIVSIASYLLGMTPLAVALFWFNVVAYLGALGADRGQAGLPSQGDAAGHARSQPLRGLFYHGGGDLRAREPVPGDLPGAADGAGAGRAGPGAVGGADLLDLHHPDGETEQARSRPRDSRRLAGGGGGHAVGRGDRGPTRHEMARRFRGRNFRRRGCRGFRSFRGRRFRGRGRGRDFRG